MYQIKVNELPALQVEWKAEEVFVNGAKAEWNAVVTGENKFSIIQDNISYNAEIVNVNTEEKSLSIRINNNIYNVNVKDRFDILLAQMGMTNATATKANDLKAPMPGLVLKINVAEGQAVKKGDSLLILEAMKMENVLKAAGDGVVKTIKVKTKDAVEKGQLLIQIQ